MQLYRGELLPGCYDDWILPERERLQQRFIETLEQLILLLQNRGDYRGAINYAERLLSARTHCARKSTGT
jgi:DNA-binding SARP family transcriptional activator